MTDAGSSQWTLLAESAASRDLYLEPATAQRCAVHCDEFIVQLEQLREQVATLRDVDGFGTFPSGTALATKFSQKAAGGDVYSMSQALADHIATVTEMRDVFTRIHTMYTGTEQDNTALFDGADGGN